MRFGTVMEDDSSCYFALVVSKVLVKETKNALERLNRLDKRIKIKSLENDDVYSLIHGNLACTNGDSFLVPITATHKGGDFGVGSLAEIINLPGNENLSKDIGIASVQKDITEAPANLLAHTVHQWLRQQSRQEQSSRSTNDNKNGEIEKAHKWAYSVYQPMLLLSPNVYSNILSTLKIWNLIDCFPSLYHQLCIGFKVTHIALNAPIPKSINVVSYPADPNGHPLPKVDIGSTPNVLRSPTGLTPLHGDFGLNISLDHYPTAEDFASAFWCSTQQNDIHQVWAPRYTMFSRGNISEKTRILELASVRTNLLEAKPQQSTAVDLYAGIGYFAFSYAKAGVEKVLCWEMNPWSVEGLRKGAERNNWPVKIVSGGKNHEMSPDGGERLLVFQESNEYAAARISSIRDAIPPVKHINCGLLPSSKDSWEIAVQVLDSSGGWVHVHENIAKEVIELRKDEIVTVFNTLLKKNCHKKSKLDWTVECEHVAQVKSYAPGIMHCVLDITINRKHL